MKFINATASRLTAIVFVTSALLWSCTPNPQIEAFPDGTPISDWFKDSSKVELSQLGQTYSIADYGAVADDSTINTEAIQKTIDEAAANGGGVIVVPEGTFRSGAIFFKKGTHLHLADGGVLKGSDTIADYPIMASRMEGQSLDYFPALVNAYGVDSFTISGKGTIDGNGLKYWEAFWARRKENPKCTNLEVSRPRLLFVQNSNDIQIQDVKLHNSGFWTAHIYKCNNVKFLGVDIFAPKEPVPAPSSDAIDLDVCSNVLIKGCSMSVNDDAIAMKGGKGPWADKDPNNGPNFNILIEDCVFGWCHSTFTCGSESIHTRNVLMRNCKIGEMASRLIYLKMRPDTPQLYEYITIENVSGNVRTGVFIKPWRQFFDLQDRETPPLSISRNISFRNLNLDCKAIFDIGITENDSLQNFEFKNIVAKSEKLVFDPTLFEGLVLENVVVNGVPMTIDGAVVADDEAAN